MPEPSCLAHAHNIFVAGLKFLRVAVDVNGLLLSWIRLDQKKKENRSFRVTIMSLTMIGKMKLEPVA